VSCGLTKTADKFHKHKCHKGGLNNTCKQCRSEIASNSYDKKALNEPESLMLTRARSRAKAANLPFNITEEDIRIPNFCPVLGIRLRKGSGRGGVLHSSPSLDRIHPSKGYVRGNVLVVSSRANTLKNDATPEEMMSLALFYQRYSEG
jgi:hypothetical protein